MRDMQVRSKLFYGWYIVAAGLIRLYTFGFVQFGFTAIFEPIVAEFGWSHAQVSIAASLRGLEIGLAAPVMGFLVDRWGPRKLVFAGGIILAGSCFLLTGVSSLSMFYVSFFLLSVGMSTTTNTVIMTSVTRWFRKNLGLAIGISACGVGLGGLMVPILTWMIDVMQWRTTVFAVGLGMLIIVIPLSLVLRYKPEDYGYLPDGKVVEETSGSGIKGSTKNVEINVPYKKALTSRAFWDITIASTCMMFLMSAITTHIMPYFTTIGIARYTASMVASALPVVSIVGRLSSGWLCSRFGMKNVFTVSFIFLAAGTILFAFVDLFPAVLLVLFIISFSLAWGAIVTTRISLQQHYFGKEAFGAILGSLSGVMMLGNMTGAFFVGWIFDAYGDYRYAWLMCGVIGLIGIIMAARAPRSFSMNEWVEPGVWSTKGSDT